MEKRSRTPQLVDDWEVSSMQEDGCRCACERGAEAGFNLQLLGRRATARRAVPAVAAAFALLLVGLVAALVTAGLGLREQRRERPRSSQHNKVDCLQSGVDGNQQVEPPASKDLTGSKNPGARLTASNISNPHGKYLLWESKQGHVHCNGGFFYSDGDLVVPTQGYYRVYVQLTFEGEAESCKSEEMLLLTYSVFYYHDSYPSEQLLLTAVDTTTCPKKWKKSLYSSSVFFLEAKSRLCVASSLSNHVLKNENETFFGADRLPN